MSHFVPLIQVFLHTPSAIHNKSWRHARALQHVWMALEMWRKTCVSGTKWLIIYEIRMELNKLRHIYAGKSPLMLNIPTDFVVRAWLLLNEYVQVPQCFLAGYTVDYCACWILVFEAAPLSEDECSCLRLSRDIVPGGDYFTWVIFNATLIYDTAHTWHGRNKSKGLAAWAQTGLFLYLGVSNLMVVNSDYIS